MSARDPSYYQARKLYEDGFGSLAKVAKELGVSKNTVESWKKRDKASENDWIKGGNKAPKTRARKKVNACTQNKKVEPKVDIVIPDEIIEDMESSELTENQRLFCIYYIQSFNARQAALKAGYSKTFARSNVYNLLAKASIKEELEKLKEMHSRELHLETNRILNRHAQIAFSDINDYVNEDGTLKDMSEVDGTLIRKVASEKKVVEDRRFKDEQMTRETLKDETKMALELEDRSKSLDFLTKFFGLDPKQEIDRDKLLLEATKHENDLILRRAKMLIEQDYLRIARKKAGEEEIKHEDSGIDSAIEETDSQLLEEHGDLIQEE